MTCSSVSPFFTRSGDAVADDRDHVAILDDVGFVADPAVTGNHVGAALLIPRRHGDLEDPVERGDRAVDGAAVRDVDHRIEVGIEDVAGGDDVRAAEVHERVAVGVRGRHVMEHDASPFRKKSRVGVK